jgi:hypothetical protein
LRVTVSAITRQEYWNWYVWLFLVFYSKLLFSLKIKKIFLSFLFQSHKQNEILFFITSKCFFFWNISFLKNLIFFVMRFCIFFEETHLFSLIRKCLRHKVMWLIWLLLWRIGWVGSRIVDLIREFEIVSLDVIAEPCRCPYKDTTSNFPFSGHYFIGKMQFENKNLFWYRHDKQILYWMVSIPFQNCDWPMTQTINLKKQINSEDVLTLQKSFWIFKIISQTETKEHLECILIWNKFHSKNSQLLLIC